MARARKAYRVEIRQVVYDDLAAIGAFIARSHPLNAERYVLRIVDAIEALSSLPTLHPLAPSLNELGVRQLLVGSHRILFVVDDSKGVVDVLRVIHQREQIERHARGLLEN